MYQLTSSPHWFSRHKVFLGNDFGDISLLMTERHGLGYLMLWPHARPFRFSKPEPMLRALKDPLLQQKFLLMLALQWENEIEMTSCWNRLLPRSSCMSHTSSPPPLHAHSHEKHSAAPGAIHGRYIGGVVLGFNGCCNVRIYGA